MYHHISGSTHNHVANIASKISQTLSTCFIWWISHHKQTKALLYSILAGPDLSGHVCSGSGDVRFWSVGSSWSSPGSTAETQDAMLEPGIFVYHFHPFSSMFIHFHPSIIAQLNWCFSCRMGWYNSSMFSFASMDMVNCTLLRSHFGLDMAKQPNDISLKDARDRGLLLKQAPLHVSTSSIFNHEGTRSKVL